MNHIASQAAFAQRLNHVECVYRPGERALAITLFDLLGFKTYDYSNGEVYVTAIDPTTFSDDANDNYLAGREVRPEQWAFDQALMKALGEGSLARAYAGHTAMLANKPEWGMHFGVRLDTAEKWEAAVARFQDLPRHAPSLVGRVKVLQVYRPQDTHGNGLHQAFFWTDILASGSLAFGQNIELTMFTS